MRVLHVHLGGQLKVDTSLVPLMRRPWKGTYLHEGHSGALGSPSSTAPNRMHLEGIKEMRWTIIICLTRLVIHRYFVNEK